MLAAHVAMLGMMSAPFSYPPTRTVPHVDVYHGVTVPDPYRWLENLTSTDTKSWVEAQNEVTFDYLRSIPGRDAIRDRLLTVFNYERYGLPTRVGDRYVFSKNDGLQNQSVLYIAESLDDEPRVLIDPNQWSEDGTIALAGTSFSDDGSKLAFAQATGGSDWREWSVMNVDTGEILSDKIRWSKFSTAAWNADGSGFYYLRFPEPSEDQTFQQRSEQGAVYFHRVGSSQDKDVLVFEAPEPDWFVSAGTTEDKRYLLIYLSERSARTNRYWAIDLHKGGEPTRLLDDNDAEYTFVGNVGPRMLFQTSESAPFGRVIEVDFEDPSQKATVIAERSETLDSVSYVGGELIARYMQDGRSVVVRYSPNGQLLGEIELPGLGTASAFTGRSDHDEAFYSFASFTSPSTIYRYDFETGESSVFRRPEIALDLSRFDVKLDFVMSTGGARVPLYIIHRKDIQLNGENPTMLYGYGGFRSPQRPVFSTSRLAWLELGGVYVVAGLRGGTEYGEEWYQAGIKTRKQNVFDDFIAAAEWLIDRGYTSKDKLAIKGGSNGGLLVGAAMTQRPDLFQVALPAVGVMDMLRFNQFTIGWAWESDYGSPQNATEFQSLLSYSPYHNLLPGTHYPATLVTTADTDDRVVPSHSFKFAARLQAAQGGPLPTMIRVEVDAGHGAGTPLTKVVEEIADEYAFALHNMGEEIALR